METFEFLLITMSIVVGLGIAEILNAVARILRGELTAGWLHSLWMTAILISLLQNLWVAWEYQGRADWTFLHLLVLTAPRLLLFVLAAVLNPPPDTEVPLDDYFMGVRRRFFGVGILFLVFAIIDYRVLVEGPHLMWPDVIRVVVGLIYAGLAFAERRSVQILGGLVCLGIFLAFTFTFTFTLLQMLGVGG